jgi:hypothetical protein
MRDIGSNAIVKELYEQREYPELLTAGAVLFVKECAI